NGLLKPTGGSILIDGLSVTKQRVSSLARKIGFVFQNPDHQIFNDRVDREVAFGPCNLGLTKEQTFIRVAEALQAVGLGDFAEVSPQELSKGQRQRLALASVLAMKTEIIVFDEPTTGQDYKEALQIMDLVAELNKKGHTILFITHDMSLVARYARRVIALCEGSVLMDGPVNEVFAQVEKLNKTFIEPPQICQLASVLGLGNGVLSPEDLMNQLAEIREGMGHVCCG
ncbi:MAG TPA: ATP-binding cassette domain-containing protein, partial [Verrucomicrobiae bacterium]|nr:ATP-binding cassette domain-containing protein [Verrucomicrobiae bacterium]